MSEVRLNLVDGERAINGTLHAGAADALNASLAADPGTIEELEAAFRRFQLIEEGRSWFARFSSGVRDEPWDAGIVYIDLAARLVASENSYFVPTHRAGMGYHDGKCLTEKSSPFHISDAWKLDGDVESFTWHAEQRRALRLENPPLDTRAILYGKAAEFIVDECVALAETLTRDSDARDKNAASQRDEPADDWHSPPFFPPHGWQFRELTSRADKARAAAETTTVADAVAEIHARWLMTPRDDLRGQSPRDVLAAGRDHLAFDMQDREHHWSIVGFCPPPLSEESHAYRYGDLGTHENVIYYDLLREMVWECWRRVVDADGAAHPAIADAVGANTETAALLRIEALAETERLNAFMNAWLDEPNCEFSGHVPREVIENERRRIPESSSPHEAIVDHDCPLCQAMVDEESPLFGGGPMFWHLDGAEMDEDFPFDIWCATLEEWEEKQREWEDFNLRFAEGQAQREAAGESLKWDDDDDLDEDSPWETSFSGPSRKQSLSVALFSVGAHLGEIISDIKHLGADSAAVDSLNRQYGNLREAMHHPEAELIHPVIDRFCEEISELAAAWPDLTAKADALAEELRDIAGRLKWDNELPF